MELRLKAVCIYQLLKSSQLTLRKDRCCHPPPPTHSSNGTHTQCWRGVLRPVTVERLAVPSLQTFLPGQLTYQRVKQSALIRKTRGPLAALRYETLLRLVFFRGHSSLQCRRREMQTGWGGIKIPPCPEIDSAMMFSSRRT